MMQLTWTGVGARDERTVVSYRMTTPDDPVYQSLGEPITNALTYAVVLTSDHINKLHGRSLAPSGWAMGSARAIFGLKEDRAKQLLAEGRKRLGTGRSQRTRPPLRPDPAKR